MTPVRDRRKVTVEQRTESKRPRFQSKRLLLKQIREIPGCG